MPQLLSKPNHKMISLLLLACLAVFSTPQPGISLPTSALPYPMSIIGFIPPYSSQVATDGDYVYIGAGTSLVIYSIAGGSAPVRLSYIFLSDTILDLSLEDSSVYILTKDQQIWNISVVDPTRPVARSIYPTYESMVSIDVEESLVYLGGHGLQIVDESDPYGPETIEYTSTVITSLAVSNHMLYISTYGGPYDDYAYFAVIDATDPENPQKVAELPLEANIGGGALRVTDILVDENRAVLAEEPNDDYHYGGCAGDFLVIDISDPLHPFAHQGVQITGIYHTKNPYVAISGNFIYAACEADYLGVYDISNPDDVIEIGSLKGQNFDLAVSNDLLISAAGPENLRIYLLADPAHPSLFLNTPGIGRAEDVIVSGNAFFIADGGIPYNYGDSYDGGLSLGIFTVPGSETILSKGQASSTHLITSGGAKVYLYNYWSSIWSFDLNSYLTVFDVSDPANPIETIDFPIQNDPPHIPNQRDIAVYNQKVYLTTGQPMENGGGFIIIDMNDPDAITQEYFEVGFPVTGVDQEDHYLYTAAPQFGVFIYDLDLANNPTLIGWYSMHEVIDVAVRNGIALITKGTAEARLINVTDPGRILNVATIDPQGDAQKVSAMGIHKFLIAGGSSVKVVDISQPAHPFISATFDTPGIINDIAAQGQAIFVADEKSGLFILTQASPYYLPLIASSLNPGH